MAGKIAVITKDLWSKSQLIAKL
jgi:putative transposase